MSVFFYRRDFLSFAESDTLCANPGQFVGTGFDSGIYQSSWSGSLFVSSLVVRDSSAMVSTRPPDASVCGPSVRGSVTTRAFVPRQKERPS